MSIGNFTVLEENAGERLDKFLAAQTGLSRSYIQKLVDNPSRKIKAGEEISIQIPEAKPLDLTPYELKLDIVYESDDLLVVNKPAGLTVHPAAGNWDKTLVHALLFHCKGQLSGINGVERPGIVHRLDKDTSGLMVVAKNDETHKRLAAQIEAREIKRHYIAVVHGIPNPLHGIIRTGFGRHPTDRKKMTTYDLIEDVYNTGGSSRWRDYNNEGQIWVGSKTEFGMERGEGKNTKIAITEYSVMQVMAQKYSLVECRLQTGRTHQIRVHMKHIKCPIVGDDVYGSSKLDHALKNVERELVKKSMKAKAVGVESPSWINRQALHAYKLEIPDVGIFEAPLPDDMIRLIESL